MGATFNLAAFDIGSMIRFGAALRGVAAGAETMERAAQHAVRLVFDALVDDDGKPATALVEAFVTAPLGALPTNLQAEARRREKRLDLDAQTRCVALLATAGIMPTWNDQRTSPTPRVLSVEGEALVESAPLLASILGRLGVAPRSTLGREPPFLGGTPPTFEVFHLEHVRENAEGAPHGIRSALGLGGRLRHGAFVMMVFTRIRVDVPTGGLFRPFALNLKLALAPYEGRVFG